MATNTLPLVKVVMGGFIGTTDRWSTSSSFIVSGGTPSPADMNGIANGAATLWAADFWDIATTGMHTLAATGTSWDECKTYYYPPLSDAATVSGSKTITPDFGVNSTFLPPQLAIVVSLHTGFAGRKFRGRNYLPPAGIGLSTGRINSAAVTGIATNFAKYLTDMNSATVGALSFNACIGTHGCPEITSVSVDNIFDTQRRRRDKQVSTQTATSNV